MALVNFIRQGATTAAQTINFSVGGTATFNTDYTIVFPPGIPGTWAATSGSVTIPIGSSQVDVTLNIVGDTFLEPNETIVIAITSVSPPVGISSLNNAAVLIIKNDDFTVNFKYIGVGSIGTALIGSVATNGGSPIVGSNNGNAPANWNNWLQGGSVGGALTFGLANGQTNPELLKLVIRSPIFSPINTTTTYPIYVSGSPTEPASLIWRGNSSGTWDLIGRNSASASLFTFPAIAVSTWVDLFLEVSPLGNTAILNGVTTIGYTASPGYILNQLQFTFNSTAVAACSLTSGSGYSSSLSPITPANL